MKPLILCNEYPLTAAAATTKHQGRHRAVTQKVKVPATKLDDPSSIPWTQTGRELSPAGCPLTSTLVRAHNPTHNLTKL